MFMGVIAPEEVDVSGLLGKKGGPSLGYAIGGDGVWILLMRRF
jgi:hypothetical protein